METDPNHTVESATPQLSTMRVSDSSGDSVDQEAYEQVLADRERLSKSVHALRQEVTKLQIKLLRKDMDYRAEREAREKLLGWIHMKRISARSTACTSQAATALDSRPAEESMFWISQFKTTSMCGGSPLRENEMSIEEQEEYVSRNCNPGTSCPKPCPASESAESKATTSRTTASLTALTQPAGAKLLPGEILRSKSEASVKPGDYRRGSTGEQMECAVFGDESESSSLHASGLKSHPAQQHHKSQFKTKSKPLQVSASMDDARLASGVRQQSLPQAGAVASHVPVTQPLDQHQQAHAYLLQT